MLESTVSLNICFSTTQALLSRLIRFATRSKVSHALITFRSETLDMTLVMEAVGTGFRILPWKKWRLRNQLVARFELAADEGTKRRALNEIAEHLGTQYDRWSLLGFARRRWKKRVRNPLNDPGKLICSEVVARFLDSAGIDGFEDPGSWTPEDLFRSARDRSDTFRMVSDDEAHFPASASRHSPSGK